MCGRKAGSGVVGIKDVFQHRRPCKGLVEDVAVHRVVRTLNPYLDAVIDEGHFGPGCVVKYVDGHFVDSAATLKQLVQDALRWQNLVGDSAVIEMAYIPAQATGHTATPPGSTMA